MKVEQRIGRIDRIGQEHADIYVLNLCYADSAEHIVYGRLLTRLAEIGAIVGTQQLSLLPVTREEFQQLADKTLTETELEQRATERALWAAAARQVWRCRHRTSTVPTCVWSNRGATHSSLWISTRSGKRWPIRLPARPGLPCPARRGAAHHAPGRYSRRAGWDSRDRLAHHV